MLIFVELQNTVMKVFLFDVNIHNSRYIVVNWLNGLSGIIYVF